MSDKSFALDANAIVIEISSGSESESVEQVSLPRLRKRVKSSNNTGTTRQQTKDKRRRSTVTTSETKPSDNKDANSELKSSPPHKAVLRRRNLEEKEKSTKSTSTVEEGPIVNEDALISIAARLLQAHNTRSHDDQKVNENAPEPTNGIGTTSDVPALKSGRRTTINKQNKESPLKQKVMNIPASKRSTRSVTSEKKNKSEVSEKSSTHKESVKSKQPVTPKKLSKAKAVENMSQNELQTNHVTDKQVSIFKKRIPEFANINIDQKRQSAKTFLEKELLKFGTDKRRIHRISTAIEDEIFANFEGELYKSQFRRIITAFRNHEAGFGRHLYELSLDAKEFAKMDANNMVSEAQKLAAKELKEGELLKRVLNRLTSQDIDEMKKARMNVDSYFVTNGKSLDEDDYVNE